MWLNEAPSRATSSSPLTTMRSCSCPAASFSDTSAAWLTGLTTFRVTYQATAPISSASTAPPASSTFWISSRVFCAVLRS